MGTTHWLQRPQTCWKFDKEASRNITVTPPQTNQKKVYSLQPSPQTSPLKNHLLEFPSGLAVGTAKKKKKKKKRKKRKTKQNKTNHTKENSLLMPWVGKWVYWAWTAGSLCLAPCNKHCVFLNCDPVSADWLCCRAHEGTWLMDSGKGGVFCGVG